MDKDIIKHEEYMSKAISELENSEKDREKAAHDLYAFHIDRVRDFQHERSIHLIVTLFFAVLFLLSMYVLLEVTSLQYGYRHISLLMILSGFLAGILLLTELLYVRHYYKLENGTQRLYELTVRLKTFF